MSTIMVVDDSAFIRNHLAKFLGSYGHETILAEDGEEAVRTYRAKKPDVVLMDITMPRMNGMDALADIRLRDPRAKVIMLTALDQRLIAARAVQLGAQDFLIKPVLPAQLLAALKKALRSRP
jgi:two-component system chemotaxis response regulator CheY